jgi:sphinganine-1-phosphate aldolase
VGGLYATPSFCGSRHGFSSAGAWYAMTHILKSGYKQNSKTIIEKTKQAISNLKQIKGITIFGNPRICAFAFNT